MKGSRRRESRTQEMKKGKFKKEEVGIGEEVSEVWELRGSVGRTKIEFWENKGLRSPIRVGK